MMGGSPANAANCLTSKLSSSGVVAMSWLAVSAPTPAMLGSGLTDHSQKSTVAASARAEK